MYSKHVTWNKLYGQVSADVQGKQENWHFLQDSDDVKAAAVLGSCFCRTKYCNATRNLAL
jgi:hypothetical protein